jgi:hypothetical protein
MADVDLTALSNQHADKRTGRGISGDSYATPTNYDNIAALKARLTAAAPSSYPTARLNSMTKGDLIYAVRLIDDAAGIK